MAFQLYEPYIIYTPSFVEQMSVKKLSKTMFF